MDADAVQWVINSADRSPAFDTVNAGYDVWLGNNRGSRYSTMHMTLDPANKEFWDWSFEEMGLYDVPVEIDFILKHTGQSKLSYVAHSMGTAQMFIGLSMLNDYYRERMNLFVALAPISRISNTESVPLQMIAKHITPMAALIEKIGMWNMFGPNYLVDNLVADFCDHALDFCVACLKAISDGDPSVDNLDRVKTYFTHIPSGSGYKNQLHFAQIINSAKFARYDHGAAENLKRYGSTTPPDYNLRGINGVPIALFGGSTDLLVSKTDVDWLNDQLGEAPVWYKQYPLGHMSFAIAKDMSWYKQDVLNLINQYSTNDFKQGFLSI
jgi:pimeloyl-ACP methyl ester carboxylesterase